MSNVKVNFNKEIGKIKVMHAVNNGPCVANGSEQTRGNQDTFKACRIPYARTHDASFHAGYGGNHTLDVNFIFTDFDFRLILIFFILLRSGFFYFFLIFYILYISASLFGFIMFRIICSVISCAKALCAKAL